MTLRFGSFFALFALFVGIFCAQPATAQTNLCTSQATGTTVTYNIFSNCHTVTNSTGATICVFTGTSGEWSTFTASSTPWSGVSVGACSCTGTPCGTIADGGTCTVYASSAPSGPCTSSTITCSGTTASGGNGYTATSCTAGCSSTSTTWSSCSGSVAAATAGGAQTVSNTASGYTGSETATCDAGGSGAFAYSGASCAASCSCTLPSNIGGGTLACGNNVTTPYYYKANTTYNTCTCIGLLSCGAVSVTAFCSSGGVLTCSDGYGDSGCTGSYYTSCTHHTVSSCFVGRVSITLADGTLTPVDHLKPGDQVKGPKGANHVVDVKVIESDQDLYGFNGGDAFVTGGHPFMTKNGWKAIDPSLTPNEGHDIAVTKLSVGDVVLTEGGAPVTITSIDRHASVNRKVYNPIMDGDHTYFANGFLVHNKCNGVSCY